MPGQVLHIDGHTSLGDVLPGGLLHLGLVHLPHGHGQGQGLRAHGVDAPGHGTRGQVVGQGVVLQGGHQTPLPLLPPGVVEEGHHLDQGEEAAKVPPKPGQVLGEVLGLQKPGDGRGVRDHHLLLRKELVESVPGGRVHLGKGPLASRSARAWTTRRVWPLLSSM